MTTSLESLRTALMLRPHFMIYEDMCAWLKSSGIEPQACELSEIKGKRNVSLGVISLAALSSATVTIKEAYKAFRSVHRDLPVVFSGLGRIESAQLGLQAELGTETPTLVAPFLNAKIVAPTQALYVTKDSLTDDRRQLLSEVARQMLR
jgi:hypothetical protein